MTNVLFYAVHNVLMQGRSPKNAIASFGSLCPPFANAHPPRRHKCRLRGTPSAGFHSLTQISSTHSPVIASVAKQSSAYTSAMTDLFCHCEERSDVAIQCTYQNAFLQLWYVKTKKTWQLLKITTLVLKITLNSEF